MNFNFAQAFNNAFANPYQQFMPPGTQQAPMQQQNMLDLAAAMMANSYSRKDGWGAMGDALTQYSRSRSQNSAAAMEMARLQQAMQIAQGKYEGKDARFKQAGQHHADRMRQRELDRAAQERIAKQRSNPFAGMFPPGFGQPQTSPREDYENAPEPAQGPRLGQTVKAPGGLEPGRKVQRDANRARQALSAPEAINRMSKQELQQVMEDREYFTSLPIMQQNQIRRRLQQLGVKTSPVNAFGP